MRILEAIEYLKKNLPSIETSIMGDAQNEEDIIDLQIRFQNLYKSLKVEDIKAIRHCLRAISLWYQNRTNYHNYGKVRRINELAGTFIETNKEPIIFLSHSSRDWMYANPLRTFISELGVADNRIIYTSHFKHKIPFDENIYEYLAKKIHENCLMVNLWSENYFNSIACICETGAAWVSGCVNKKICIPPLSFNDQRFGETPIEIKKMGIVLDGSDMCRVGMAELGNDIRRFFRVSDCRDIEPPLNTFIVEIINAEKERKMRQC